MPDNAEKTKKSARHGGVKSGDSSIETDGINFHKITGSKRVSVLVEEFDLIDARSREKPEAKGTKNRGLSITSSKLNQLTRAHDEQITESQSSSSSHSILDLRFVPTRSSPSSDKTDLSDTSEKNNGEPSSLIPTPRNITKFDFDNETLEIDSSFSSVTEPVDLPLKTKLIDQIPRRDSLEGGKIATALGISEWSHHSQDTKMVEEQGDECEWQPMPSYAQYDIYDDDNKLIAREKEESDEDDCLAGASRGYTRVQLDEDAQSATSLDENTQYLFNDFHDTCAGEMEDEKQRDTVSQMQATKNLLTEGQRIAYVGMTRLILSAMIRQSENGISKGAAKKETSMASEAMKMWSQKMMLRLYAHMEISSAEQIMIEQLSEHGVVPSDLTPTLMQNSRVKNPMAEMEQPTSESVVTPTTSSPKLQEGESTIAPPYEEHDSDDLPEVRTPSQLPKTANLDIDLRWTVLCDLFLTLIADSIYDARSRTLLEKLGDNMGVDWLDICKFEKRVTDALEMQQQAEKENWDEDKHKESRRQMALKKRYVMMGLATVGGSLVIGLSAGLLAPVIGAGLAAGFTTIGVAGTGGFLAGAGGAAIITSGAAASGGLIAVRAANRRTGAVKTFEYRPLHNNRRVNLIVTVSGWMTGKVDDVRLPYSTVDPIMGDIYSVLWEPEMLRSMGDTINILATEALTQGLQQVLGSTILISLMAALQLPVVLTKLAYLIDNPWTVSLDRANSAGLILADSLIDRNLGTRPITFVGYSLGSRVIFSCLRELSRKGAYGLVQNVYLFGSPVVAKKDEYLKVRSVVAGRFVNGYATNDWILGYLFRLTSGGISRVAGLAPVEDVYGVENLDVTDIVPGHMSYRTAMPQLLRKVGWAVESDEFAEIEDPDPDNHQQRQRELINEIEEARKELEKKDKEKESKGKFGFFSRKKKNIIQKADWETYKESSDSQYSKSRVEDEYGNNHGVLFDIEAIRAQLLSEQMEVKELKSTLPPMKLKLNISETSSSESQQSLSTSQLTVPPKPATLRTSHQNDDLSQIPVPIVGGFVRADSVLLGYSGNYREEDLESSIDSGGLMNMNRVPNSFQKPTRYQKFSQEINTSSKDTSLTTISLGKPLDLSSLDMGHNAWAEDDEFSEKEVQMTFA